MNADTRGFLPTEQDIRVKPSVLLVGNFLSSVLMGGHICEDLAEHLANVHWDVITASDKSNRIRRLFEMVRTAWTRRDQYSVAQIDVYSGKAFFWAEAVCEVLSWAKKPYVLTLHGGNLPTFSKRWPKRVRRLLHSANLVTTPSLYLLEQMNQFRPDIHLLYNPVDLSTYKYRFRAHPQARLVWARAFHRTYNPLLALKVVTLLAKDFPDVELTMVGPDKGDGSLQAVQRFVEEQKLSSRIVLQPGVLKNEMPTWLDKGDIFINTTYIDNTPVTVLEAMGCGLCVVSTNVGGIPYLLEHEHDSLLVPSNNPPSMAAAVARILTENGLFKRLTSNGQIKVSNYDRSIVFPQWEKLLRSVSKTNQQ